MTPKKRTWLQRLFGTPDSPEGPGADRQPTSGKPGTPGTPDTSGAPGTNGTPGTSDTPATPGAPAAPSPQDSPSTTPVSSGAGASGAAPSGATGSPRSSTGEPSSPAEPPAPTNAQPGALTDWAAPLDPGDDPLADPHPSFPHFSMRQVVRVEREVSQALDARGFTSSFGATTVKFSQDGGRSGVLDLNRLMSRLNRLPDFDAEMPLAVDRFVAAWLEAEADQPLSDAAFYAAMRVRLSDIADKGDEEFTRDAPIRPFTEDSFIRLVLDLEDSIQGLLAPALEDRGPVEDLYRMGYRNLWQELIDSDMTFREYAPNAQKPEEKCWLMQGDNYFIGSAPLFLDELFEHYAPHVDRSQGVIFAMPFRHIALAREVTSGHDLMNSIGLMASLAAELYTTQPGAISPRLHLAYMGEITTITDVKRSGPGGRQVEIHIKPNAHLIGRIGDGLDGPGRGDASSDDLD